MKAVIRGDGEFYRVLHNGHRLSGQFYRVQAETIRDRINKGQPNGCGCVDCAKARTP